jgi:hypothetical protein
MDDVNYVRSYPHAVVAFAVLGRGLSADEHEIAKLAIETLEGRSGGYDLTYADRFSADVLLWETCDQISVETGFPVRRVRHLLQSGLMNFAATPIGRHFLTRLKGPGWYPRGDDEEVGMFLCALVAPAST